MGVYKNNNETLEPIAGGTLYADNPIGTILAFGGSDIPTGWHLCDGTAVSRTTYAELFSVIGTSFGTGDGSTTFNLPDLRGEFLRGAGTNSHTNNDNGGAVGAHQDCVALPNYNAILADGSPLVYRKNAGNLIFDRNRDASLGDDASTAAFVLSGNDNTGDWAKNQALVIASRPTNTSINYIIKMFKIGAPADFDGQDIYSTTERRVGTWIDGKPLYRKVFTDLNFGGDASSGWHKVSSSGVYIPNIDTLCNARALRQRNDTVRSVVAVVMCFAVNTSDELLYNTVADYANCNEIVVEYTKTTD